MDNRPIGVLDSGFGGLSIVKELRKILPNEDIVYLDDAGLSSNDNMTKQAIFERFSRGIEFLKGQNVKTVVAVCDVAGTVITEEQLKCFDIPCFSIVIPSAQGACATSISGRIGVIGTAVAVQSMAFGRAIRSIRPSAIVIGNACPEFIPLIKNGEDIKELARKNLENVKKESVDTLILGSIFFPTVFDVISEATDYSLVLVDPCRETATHLRKYLMQNHLLAEGGGSEKFFVTDKTDAEKLFPLFLGRTVENIEQTERL